MFGSAEDANVFLRTTPSLGLARHFSTGLNASEMQQLAEQLHALVRDFYVHLPVKTSALAIDPLQELVLLADDVRYGLDERTYLQRLVTTMKRMRDRHTGVRLPDPWTSAVAFLPFTVEACWQDNKQVLLVTKLLAGLEDPHFRPGAVISHWNGVPIDLWIRRVADGTDGANPWSRIAVALRSLTVRPLAYQLPPDEDWVTVTFDGPHGPRSIVLPWRVYFPTDSLGAAVEADATPSGLALGVDRPTAVVNNAWRDLYARDDVATRTKLTLSALPAVTATTVPFGRRLAGYVRIFSFDVNDEGAFLDAMAELLSSLSIDGLILDVRANPGGSIPAAEGLLQMLTDRVVIPERLEFRGHQPAPAARRLVGLLYGLAPIHESAV